MISVNANSPGEFRSYFAPVVSATGTSLTLSRPFPADADAGTY